MFGAFGEELECRGFLLPKVVAGGVRHPAYSGFLFYTCYIDAADHTIVARH